MTIAELEKTIRDIFVTLVPSGTTIVWANENGPRVDLPYLTLNLVTKSSKVGSRDDMRSEEIAATDDDPAYTQFTLHGQRTGLLSVNAYGKNAIQLSEDLKDKLQLEACLSLLRDAGVAVLNEGETRDLSLLVDTKIERRAQFDLTLGYTVTIDESINTIAKVQFVNKLTDPDGEFEVELE